MGTAETIYFNEPDVQVTESRIVTPWGLYQPQDVQSVYIEREKGIRYWLWRIAGSIGPVSLLLLIADMLSGQVLFGIPRDALTLVTGVSFLLTYAVISPRYKVKMHGSFGVVIFDCGDNNLYASRLTKALQTLIQARESQPENRSGAV
jgi:hypothetical protein